MCSDEYLNPDEGGSLAEVQYSSLTDTDTVDRRQVSDIEAMNGQREDD